MSSPCRAQITGTSNSLFYLSRETDEHGIGEVDDIGFILLSEPFD